jgi:cytochrome c-type biogenesis protein CcmE
MNKRSKRKLLVVMVLFGVALATVLGLTAFKENLLYFYSPSQIKAGEAPSSRSFRIGGLVVNGSVQREEGGLAVKFDLTDNNATVPVTYTGILPDLFREGQGIVAMGSLDSTGLFVADEVLAKHDENYMPPEVADALKAADAAGRQTATP